jgi:hypothetical protein
VGASRLVFKEVQGGSEINQLRSGDPKIDLQFNQRVAFRLNNIRFKDSDKGTLGEGRTRDFRLVASGLPGPIPPPPPPGEDRPNQEPPFPAAFWRSFWGTDIPHNARNVWSCLLIKKLPSSGLLHAITPAIVGPQCRICEAEHWKQIAISFSDVQRSWRYGRAP